MEFRTVRIVTTCKSCILSLTDGWDTADCSISGPLPGPEYPPCHCVHCDPLCLSGIWNNWMIRNIKMDREMSRAFINNVRKYLYFFAGIQLSQGFRQLHQYSENFKTQFTIHNRYLHISSFATPACCYWELRSSPEINTLARRVDEKCQQDKTAEAPFLSRASLVSLT